MRGNAIFPPSIGGRFSILFAILRQLSLVLSVAVFSPELKQLDPDVFFIDQLSACIPLLRLLYPKAKVLFYGHFPDRLLAKEGSGTMKSIKNLYRRPFDMIESWSTGCADAVVVNSKFTRSVFKQTFPSMRTRDLKVVYPCVDTKERKVESFEDPLWPNRKTLLSINRFEGKKNLGLAIRAFAGLSSDEIKMAKLVIAGGFDSRVAENANTLRELQSLADSLKLSHATYQGTDKQMAGEDHNITFLLSVPDDLKRRLLNTASLLIYTPQNEHFGIVPIEAMLAGVPVLATNTGGPLETIYDGRTGWLRSPDKLQQWTDVMRKPLILSSADSLHTMGQRGRERVLVEFSHTKMTESINQEIQRLNTSNAERPKIISKTALACCAIATAVCGLIVVALTSIAITRRKDVVSKTYRAAKPGIKGDEL